MIGVNGLHGHIQRNTWKSILLLAGFVGLVSVFWYAWCVIYSALWWTPTGLSRHAGVWPRVVKCLWHALDLALWRWWVPLLAALCWFCIAYAFHASLIRLATGARAVSRREEPYLYNLVENLSISAGLPMPSVEIMETSALNAYAAGLGSDDAVVAVTRGLLESLDRDELEAVLAHELTHIKNHDVRLMVVASVFAGGLTMVGTAVHAWAGSGGSSGINAGDVLSALAKGGLRSRSREEAAARGAAFLAALVAILIAVAALCLVHLFAILTQFAISRSREYLADAGAVELTKNPDALISALMKISGRDALPELPASVSAMMISARFEGLFSTHPPMSSRIQALQEHAGGQLPTTRPRRAARATAGAFAAEALAAPTGAIGFGRRRIAPR
jgi:heat shock protein HtpX